MPATQPANNKKIKKVTPVNLTPMPDKEIFQIISNASKQFDVDMGYMLAMAKQESHFNPLSPPKSKDQTASGLYQFIDGTWDDMVKRHGKQHGIKKEDRFDARASATMAAIYANENQKKLKDNLSIKIGPTELYFAHFLGATGAVNFFKGYKKNNNVLGTNLVSKKAAKDNHGAFYDMANNPLTAQTIYDNYNKKIGATARAYNEKINAPDFVIPPSQASATPFTPLFPTAPSPSSKKLDIEAIPETPRRKLSIEAIPPEEKTPTKSPQETTFTFESDSSDSDTESTDDTNNICDEIRTALTEMDVIPEDINAVLKELNTPEELLAANQAVQQTLKLHRLEHSTYIQNEIRGYEQGLDFITKLGRKTSRYCLQLQPPITLIGGQKDDCA